MKNDSTMVFALLVDTLDMPRDANILRGADVADRYHDGTLYAEVCGHQIRPI